MTHLLKYFKAMYNKNTENKEEILEKKKNNKFRDLCS